MDLYAIFVDVGYLCAATQITCLGVSKPSRKTLQLDQSGIIRLLQEKAAWGSGQRHLRTYWYDGAANGIPNAEHLHVDLIDDVKVRLGRLNSRGQQKGVDALIYRDLMTLARERAISHAYLVSGDGDLIEGVRVAQDLGVHVTLMYVQAGTGGNTVSPELRREVDRRVELTNAELAPFVAAASVVTSPNAQEADPAELRSLQEVLALQRSAQATEQVEQDDQQLIKEVANEYAQEWMGSAANGDLKSLAASHPRIPRQLDAELLRRAEAAVGPLTARQSLRHALRSAFWNELREVIDKAADTGAAKRPNELDESTDNDVLAQMH